MLLLLRSHQDSHRFCSASTGGQSCQASKDSWACFEIPTRTLMQFQIPSALCRLFVFLSLWKVAGSSLSFWELFNFMSCFCISQWLFVHSTCSALIVPFNLKARLFQSWEVLLYSFDHLLPFFFFFPYPPLSFSLDLLK